MYDEISTPSLIVRSPFACKKVKADLIDVLFSIKSESPLKMNFVVFN